MGEQYKASSHKILTDVSIADEPFLDQLCS